MHKHCIVLVSQYHLFCNCGIALAGQYNTLVSYWPSQYTHFKIRVLYRWANPPDTSPIHQVLVWYWRANTQISDFVYHIGPTNTGPWQAPIYVSNKKSWILPKFMHFSSLFIHVSWVTFPPRCGFGGGGIRDYGGLGVRMAHPQPHKVIFVHFFGQIPREMTPHGFLLAIFPPLTSKIPKRCRKEW
jgi:hypothetical protein